MSTNDDLPQWAASAGEPAGEYMYRETPRRGQRVVTWLAAIAALAAMAVGGYLLAGYLDDNATTAATDSNGSTTADDTADDDTTDGDTADDDTAADAGDDEPTGAADDVAAASNEDAAEDEEAADADGESTDDDTADSDTADDTADSDTGDDTADDPADSDTADDTAGGSDSADTSQRTAVFRQGKLYLGGTVPSQEVADAILGKAAAVVGPENVEVDYDIDPDVPFDPNESTPLYVEDVVLFQFNSVSVDPQFVPILDLGVVLLAQNPQASVTVITRTDARGSESTNIKVATQRATAILEYWVSKGVDPSQVILDPRGEEGTSEDDDEQTAATQRRAEFFLTNILG